MQLLTCTSTFTVPGSPNITVDTTVDSSISLSWSDPEDSVVTSYEVEWISDDCPEDVDEDNDTTTGTSYTIDSVRGDSSYNISVNAINAAGSSPSDRVTTKTNELGKEWHSCDYTYYIHNVFYTCPSSYCCPHFC